MTHRVQNTATKVCIGQTINALSGLSLVFSPLECWLHHCKCPYTAWELQSGMLAWADVGCGPSAYCERAANRFLLRRRNDETAQEAKSEKIHSSRSLTLTHTHTLHAQNMLPWLQLVKQKPWPLVGIHPLLDYWQILWVTFTWHGKEQGKVTQAETYLTMP